MPNSNTAKRARASQNDMQECYARSYHAEFNSLKSQLIKSLKAEGHSCTSCSHLNESIVRCAKGRKIVSIHSICERWNQK